MENGTVKIWMTPPMDSGYIEESFEIDITGDTLLDVVLSSGAVLSGTVVLADSVTPVAGITVAIEVDADQEETVTDGSGAFSFSACATRAWIWQGYPPRSSTWPLSPLTLQAIPRYFWFYLPLPGSRASASIRAVSGSQT
jgi:hypothetical protein